MNRQALLLFLFCTPVCASTPRALPLNANNQLVLRADSSGFLTDSNGDHFTVKKLSKSLAAGFPAPAMIEVDADKNTKLGEVLAICGQFNGLKGDIQVHVPPTAKSGEPTIIRCQ